MSLDVALLLDDRSLQEWEYQSVMKLTNSNNIDANISLVVVNEEQDTTSFFKKASIFMSDFSLWVCLVAIRMIRNSIKEEPWYQQQVPLNEAIDINEVNIISCTPEPADDLGNQLPDYVVSKLSKIDIAVRFGFGILKGDALKAPKHGVLSYHHGNFSEYRGRPAGFYEMIHKKPTAGVTVQKLSDDLDAGTVLATTQCDIEDATSLQDVHDRQFSSSPPLLTEAVQALVTNQIPEQPKVLGPVYSTPNARQVMMYLWLKLNRTIFESTYRSD